MNTIATDLDGTIYLNNEIIPGVIESLLDLDKHNLKIIFITNNSSQAPMEICNKLEKLLSRDIDLDQIVTPLIILKQYLEKQFTKGMSWDNYGNPNGDHTSCWHIDHIKPCASFDLTQEDQQKECFHYTNLQPLWAIDNLKKGGKF